MLLFGSECPEEKLRVPLALEEQIAKSRQRIAQPAFELGSRLGAFAVEIAEKRRKVSSVPPQESLILFRSQLNGEWVGLPNPKASHELLERCEPSHLLGTRRIEIRQERLIGPERKHRSCRLIIAIELDLSGRESIKQPTVKRDGLRADERLSGSLFRVLDLKSVAVGFAIAL